MLTLIVAASTNGVIGHRGELPWPHCPEDMRHFRTSTMGHAVIMGRKTWDSLDGPLRGRHNIVLTSQRGLILHGADVANTFEEAVAMGLRTRSSSPRVIGGAEVYALAMPMVTTILLTEIHRDVEGDTFFRVDRSAFHETARRPGEDPAISFVTLERAR